MVKSVSSAWLAAMLMISLSACVTSKSEPLIVTQLVEIPLSTPTSQVLVVTSTPTVAAPTITPTRHPYRDFASAVGAEIIESGDYTFVVLDPDGIEVTIDVPQDEEIVRQIVDGELKWSWDYRAFTKLLSDGTRLNLRTKFASRLSIPAGQKPVYQEFNVVIDELDLRDQNGPLLLLEEVHDPSSNRISRLSGFTRSEDAANAWIRLEQWAEQKPSYDHSIFRDSTTLAIQRSPTTLFPIEHVNPKAAFVIEPTVWRANMARYASTSRTSECVDDSAWQTNVEAGARFASIYVCPDREAQSYTGWYSYLTVVMFYWFYEEDLGERLLHMSGYGVPWSVDSVLIPERVTLRYQQEQLDPDAELALKLVFGNANFTSLTGTFQLVNGGGLEPNLYEILTQ